MSASYLNGSRVLMSKGCWMVTLYTKIAKTRCKTFVNDDARERWNRKVHSALTGEVPRGARSEEGLIFYVRCIWKDFRKGCLTLDSEIGYPFIIRVPNCWFEFGELCVYRLIPSHLHKLKWRNMWTKFTQLITGNGKLIYNGGWSVICWVGPFLDLTTNKCEGDLFQFQNWLTLSFSCR